MDRREIHAAADHLSRRRGKGEDRARHVEHVHLESGIQVHERVDPPLEREGIARTIANLRRHLGRDVAIELLAHRVAVLGERVAHQRKEEDAQDGEKRDECEGELPVQRVEPHRGRCHPPGFSLNL